MKRKASGPLSEPTPKRQNTAQQPNILDPLLKAKLLRFSDKYDPKVIPKEPSRSQIINDPRYTFFANQLKPALLKEESGEKKVQLADFIINNLTKKDIPGASGNLDYVELLTNPYKTSPNTRMDFYSGFLGPKGEENEQKQGIVMSPFNSSVNPITTLMHEGTHALDDFLMRTYQKEAIDTLAKEEKKGSIGQEGEGFEKLTRLYEGARDILGNTDFSNRYNFKDAYDKNIKGSFKDLSALEDDKSPVTNFQQAQTALNSIRGRDQEPPSNSFFDFSEFPAFAMERLFDPWKIDAKTKS